MKALYYDRYGTVDKLRVKDFPQPEPGPDEILVKVHACSLNSWDWDLLRGKPYIIRMWGLSEPRYKIPGSDIAGEVVATGQSVSKFKVGDRVMGDLSGYGWGGLAEYVCARQQDVVKIHRELSYIEAAAIPQAGLLAWQGLEQLSAFPGEPEILINGAGGGAGTFAIQLAAMHGARVTAVDTHEKMDLMYSLGAHQVFDYRQINFTRSGYQYDMILDMVGRYNIRDYLRVLKPGGRYRLVGGRSKTIVQVMLLGRLFTLMTRKQIGVVPYETNRGLEKLAGLCAEGRLKIIIHKVYTLYEAAEAYRQLALGNVQGKIVFSIQA